MDHYNINKGIGKTAEFQGLKAQYLFLFAGGLLGILILVMILYIANVAALICLTIGAGGASLILWQTFSLNRKYGEHGLMKLSARKRHPKYIVCRKKVRRCFKERTSKTKKG